MRILHLPVGAGRQAWGLSRAERRAGHQSDFVAFDQNFWRLPADRVLFEPEDGVVRREIKRWLFFLASIRRYDVFHFHFGQKFFNLYPRPFKAGDSLSQGMFRFAYWFYSLFAGHFDVWLLKLLRKKMFMTFHGDDIRQGDVSLELYRYSIAQDVDSQYYDKYTDDRKRRMARYYRRFCNQVYVVSPDLLDMAPEGAKLIHYTGIDFSEWQPTPLVSSGRIRVAHAPTHRLVKGTKYLESAVRRLKERGYDFDFDLIEGLSNTEAKKRYEQADIVVDQLLAGWYGVFAVELLAMGKPVIAYIRESSLAREPEAFQSRFPVITASPDSIENVLEHALKMELAERGSLARAGREFAMRWYDADEIAREIIRDYTV